MLCMSIQFIDDDRWTLGDRQLADSVEEFHSGVRSYIQCCLGPCMTTEFTGDVSGVVTSRQGNT